MGVTQAGREKIAAGQKLRWAKYRESQRAKVVAKAAATVGSGTITPGTPTPGPALSLPEIVKQGIRELAEEKDKTILLALHKEISGDDSPTADKDEVLPDAEFNAMLVDWLERQLRFGNGDVMRLCKTAMERARMPQDASVVVSPGEGMPCVDV